MTVEDLTTAINSAKLLRVTSNPAELLLLLSASYVEEWRQRVRLALTVHHRPAHSSKSERAHSSKSEGAADIIKSESASEAEAEAEAEVEADPAPASSSTHHYHTATPNHTYLLTYYHTILPLRTTPHRFLIALPFEWTIPYR